MPVNPDLQTALEAMDEETQKAVLAALKPKQATPVPEPEVTGPITTRPKHPGAAAGPAQQVKFQRDSEAYVNHLLAKPSFALSRDEQEYLLGELGSWARENRR